MVDVGPVSSFTARSPVVLSGDRLYIDDGAGGDRSLSLAVLQASLTKVGTLTVTQPATGSTLTIADGKTLTASNTLTFTGTDGITIAFGGGLSIAAAKVLTASNTLTFTGTDGITVAFGGGLSITAAKVLTVSNTLTLAGTDSTVMTFPATSATIARTDAANTFTGVQTFSTPIATASVATMTATVGGGVPTPPNNTTTFLRGDGTFAAPAAASLTIGSTAIASGTTTRILYDNAGILGEYTITGTGTVVAMQTSPAFVTPALGVATSASLAVGGATIGTDALGVTGTTTLQGTTISGASLTFSGNFSAAAWTTNGVRYKGAAASFTDTTSSGTVTAAYTNAFGVGTILASSATTYTNYFNTYFSDPIASTNVTMTNKWALGADSLKIGTTGSVSINTTGAVTTSGFISVGTQLWINSNANSSNNALVAGTSIDTVFRRLAVRNWIIGDNASASPLAQTLTIGELSRPATDSNIAGANGTLQSGNGTGNATPSKLILQSPIAVASGTGAQTQTTGLAINIGTAVLTSYVVASLPSASGAGAGATAFVTDASTTLILGLGGTVTGGGANKVPVYSDGSNWIYG